MDKEPGSAGLPQEAVSLSGRGRKGGRWEMMPWTCGGAACRADVQTSLERRRAGLRGPWSSRRAVGQGRPGLPGGVQLARTGDGGKAVTLVHGSGSLHPGEQHSWVESRPWGRGSAQSEHSRREEAAKPSEDR